MWISSKFSVAKKKHLRFRKPCATGQLKVPLTLMSWFTPSDENALKASSSALSAWRDSSSIHSKCFGASSSLGSDQAPGVLLKASFAKKQVGWFSKANRWAKKLTCAFEKHLQVSNDPFVCRTTDLDSCSKCPTSSQEDYLTTCESFLTLRWGSGQLVRYVRNCIFQLHDKSLRIRACLPSEKFRRNHFDTCTLIVFEQRDVSAFSQRWM